MKVVSTIFLVLLIAGCAGYTAVYNPDQLDESKLAKVGTIQAKGLVSRKYSAWITIILDENGKDVSGRTALWKENRKLAIITPGNYTFGVLCTNGQMSAEPELAVKLQPGKSYLIYCEIGKGRNILGIRGDSYAEAKIKEVERIPGQNKKYK